MRSAASRSPNGRDHPASEQIAENVSRSTAARILNLGERDTRLAFTVLEDAIRRLAAAPGDRTLIFVSAGFYMTDDLRDEETNIMDRAIRANVRISSLNARGLYHCHPGRRRQHQHYRGAPGVMNIKAQYQREMRWPKKESWKNWPTATGGRYFHNNNDLKAGFAELAAAPEFVYVLGFSPAELEAGRRVSRAQGHVAKSARPGSSGPARILCAPASARSGRGRQAGNPGGLFSRDEIQDIPLELHTQFFKSSDAAAKIAVLARVNIRNLRFRKADGRNNDNLTIISGVFDRNGNYVHRACRKVVEMRLLDATLEKVRIRALP